MPLVPSLSIVVPVYGSERTLGALIGRLAPVLPELAERFEVILVNDGSPDGAWQVIAALAAAHPWVRGIDLMRNYGQHNALLCGIRAAEHDVVITMDDDLQHPPEELHKLLEKLNEGFDVVYGAPLQETHGIIRDLASQATKLSLQGIMGAQTARYAGALRAFRTRVRDASLSYQSPALSIDVLLTWGTSRFGVVFVRHDARPIGASSYTLRKLVVHATNMVTGFSTLPLRIASLVGFTFTLFGVGVLAYVLINYVRTNGEVRGFTFLAAVISLFAGAQLFSLGIVGEYLARMHVRLMEKPAFIVKSKTPKGSA